MASESLLSCILSFFAAFEESMTLNLAQTSFKLIHFGRNRKPVSYFIQAVYIVTISIFNHFGDIGGFIRTEPTVQVSKCAGA